jgi:tetratricopeptide (TPR) repeat protein
MGRVSGIRVLAFALLATLLAVSCASERARDGLAFDTAPLFGMVYDGENQPCAGVRLMVDGKEGPLSDLRGRFVVPDLARGEHRFDRTDVLHVSMTSFEQLLGMAQDALRDNRLGEAEAVLERAERLDPEDAVLRYLFAVHAWRAGRYADAVRHLDRIEGGRGRQPAVLLLLADLYERHLGDAEKAIENLEAYLLIRDDPDVRQRLEALRQRERAGT